MQYVFYYLLEIAMMVTVKLPSELEQALRQRCTAQARSIMRDALSAYLAAAPALAISARSLGDGLFGRHSGPADMWASKHVLRSAPSA